MLALAPPTTPPPRNAPLAAKSNLFSATAMLSNGSAGVAADVAASVAASADCDERTLLLSEEIVVATPTSLPSSSSAGVGAASPPTSLPLVHTTTTTQQQQNNNNVQNNNNNSSVVVSAKNMANNKNNSGKCKNNEASSSNNNNAATEAVSTATGDIEAVTTTTTADEEDMSSDLSDKFPRPQKKPGKLSKLGTKSVGLKRVSFGSSKGSMVETLVFETPTPLSEHVESTFGFEAAADSAVDTAAAAAGQPQLASTLPLAGGYSGDYAKGNLDDSGIEVQEESERSIVRVSIYQSSQPQQICPPADYLLDALDGGYNYNYNLDYATMAAAGIQQQQPQVIGLGPAYDRQQSTDSGWDNPFRPGGDLSREADEIVNMIRGGKPITPTEERTIGNGSAQHADDNCNGGAAIGESVTKSNLSQNLATAQNGTNSHASASADAGAGKAATATELSGGNNGVTSLGQVSKQVVPGPTSASHVVIDEKKNKKKGCCVLQ
ncbi:serine/threonine-protein kinase phg2 [Drosophila ficusphila]|uniref:serine/threonine-protein kinase phg2 n=1 Tax=Drosophila ficusphila TaxID=30025 RepID=UPI0007E7894E|nr:serine/threonine-protein kinase phg2 [Drosophila ficusphila]